MMTPMPMDPNIPTQDVVDLCKCPVTWELVDGFGQERHEVLELLHHAWVRTVEKVAYSSEELKLIESVLFYPDDYDLPHKHTLENLAQRRTEAEQLYLSGIGRLARINYLRPSEYGKHFTSGGPKRRQKNISYFYTDWRSSTLADLFWSWFETMMKFEEVPQRVGPIQFSHDLGMLWEDLCGERRLRIAIETPTPIGEQNCKALRHIAIDINLEGGEAHAYPISRAEAKSIMRPVDPCVVTPLEY